VTDANLVQLNGFAVGPFTGVRGDDELGSGVALAIGQGHLPPGGTPMLVHVGQATGGGILQAVVEHPEAQGIPVEG
jgi:hypothetical protein